MNNSLKMGTLRSKYKLLEKSLPLYNEAPLVDANE